MFKVGLSEVFWHFRPTLMRAMKLPFSVFVVKENSMLPKYKPSDHVVTYNWGSIKKNDVVVFMGNSRIGHDKVPLGKTPELPVYIKRVIEIEDKKVHVGGDNKKESVKMLPISINDVIGRVVWKY